MSHRGTWRVIGALVALIAVAMQSPSVARADGGLVHAEAAHGSDAPAAPAVAPCDAAPTGGSAEQTHSAAAVQRGPFEPCPPSGVQRAPRLSLLPRPSVGRRFSVAAMETAGAIGVTMAANKWVGQARWANITFDSIGTNLRRAWVLDDDQFSINQLGHPYQGMFPYTAARSAGFGFWGSAAFVVVSSGIWEIVGETEPPAANDQITTPIGGIALGEVVHRLTGSMRAQGGGWRVAAAVLDPFAEVNRLALAPLPDEYRPSSESTVSAGASVWMAGEEAPIHQARPRVLFRHREGRPGDPQLRLERPFDHYELEVAYGGGNAITTRVRGLVAGRTFGHGERVSGLWGLFLSYDYDSPPNVFRASSSAIGIGGSAAADLGAGYRLEGTAIASGVPLGAAGEVHTPPFEQRDYVMGPGAQGFFGVRLDVRDRVFASIEAHQTAVFGVDRRQGNELILHARSRLLVRVAGPHGIAAEYTDYRRFADDPLAGALRARGDVVSLYYTYSTWGGARAGW